MTTVARETGQRFMSVWQEPFHETLLAYIGLREEQRIAGLVDHAQRVRDAYRVNAAFANPRALEKEQAEVRRALVRAPSDGTMRTMTKADAVAMAQAIVAQLARHPEEVS